MYDIQWFKLEKNIFNNRKIQLLIGLKDGDTYFRVWIQLLSLAVECGDGGRLIIGNNPISVKEFSKIMGKSSKKMSKILEKFLELEMLKKEGEMFLIKNWNKYQSIDKYENYQTLNRERQKRYREKQKREMFRSAINRIYKENYIGRKIQNLNFENFHLDQNNQYAVEVARDYTNKNKAKMQANGLIITGKSGVGKTHLAGAIANKLIENDKIVLMGRLTTLLDMIKETFRDNTKSENELIELYSNVDMIIIDDLGTEKISSWALEKLYTIIQNRFENRLPIIITTRFDKKGLISRFSYSNDQDLIDATISKLYQMCYGITLKSMKKELVNAAKHNN